MREFWADILKRNCPFCKMVGRKKATKPNNSALSFLMSLLLYSFLSPAAAIWADPSPGPLTGCWSKAYSASAISHTSSPTGYDHTDRRHRSHFTGVQTKRKKKKGVWANVNSPNTQQGLFVFVLLIAAQSTGNVWAKAFQNVPRNSACVVISIWLEQWRTWVILLYVYQSTGVYVLYMCVYV